jgi:hypothetical protein
MNRMSRYSWRCGLIIASLFLTCVFAPAIHPAPIDAAEPVNAAADSVIDIGSRLQLFVDSHLVERKSNLRFALHPPVPKEVVFKFDAPYEGSMSAYVTVLHDGEKFRLYYRAGGETTYEYTALATSRDGVHWERPHLGVIDHQGSKQNNLIYRGRRKAYWESHNFTPFLDTNPAALPAEKYKAVALGKHTRPDGETVKALVILASPDGIHWQRMQEEAVITEGSFDSQNTAFWDGVRKEYVCYLRDGRDTPEGTRVRSIKRTTSKDFRNWTKPAWLDFGDTPLEHFYVNNIAPYFREPSLYLGFPMRFVPQRKTVGAESRIVDGVSDAVLISSRDGLRFDRTFMEAYLRPGPDPQNWGNAHGNMTPAWGLVFTGPHELSMYWAEHYGDIPHLRRGAMRVDGFASLQAPYAGGEFVTRPLRFQGNSLVLNYSTSAVGSVRVEVQDETARPVPGYALGDCREIYGDEIERRVSWDGDPNIATLAGRIVRLRFAMKDADLYSLRFR